MAAPPSLLLGPSSTPEDGLARFARAAKNNRYNAEAQHDYGFGLLVTGQAAEAVAWLEKAVAFAPTEPSYHTNLAAALHQVGRWNEGLYHAKRAYELNITNVLSAINVGGFHYWLGEIPEAVTWFEKAIRLDPTHWHAWWMWLFMLDFTPITAEEALAARKKFSDAFVPQRRPLWPTHTNTPDPERRLRIGLTGGDFRQHSSSYCWGPLFEHIDREKFWIFSYAHVTRTDPYTAWFQQNSNAWRDITACPDDQAIAEQIRRDEIDVLIDLGTFSEHSHLMAHLYKPAPVSLTAWGHLTGTGLVAPDGARVLDGLLVDPVILPHGHEWEITEQPVTVPHAMGWFVPKHEMPDLAPRPERPLTFGYLGRIQKLDDPTVALWADLLHVYPESLLILKDEAYLQERAATRTLERCEAWGIDPQRIELRTGSDRVTHLQAYHDVDVALDPLPQSGGATTMEALMMGVPTVTLRGDRLVRRVSASTVTTAGYPEWVAEDIGQYVEIAGCIAGQDRQAIRDRFLASHVCDGPARTRAFEDAVRGLWRTWCEQQA